MNGILKVTPEKLVAASSEFSSIDSQVVNITAEMMNLVNQLTSVWEGEASTAYRSQFAQFQTDMDKIHQKINEHSQDLQEMAKNYQDAESANIDTSMGLETNALG